MKKNLIAGKSDVKEQLAYRRSACNSFVASIS
jgi:hypothetical protein